MKRKATMPGPLEGVRILDLSSNFMGPFVALLLADLRADVVKAESQTGDTTRGVGPARHPGMGAIFLHLNRNKRSLCVDLKHEAGSAAVRRMAERPTWCYQACGPPRWTA
jgi:crotonobetainyl-CoA:carnitine CoA-transferase CaiB-like acyl-CoA transferase